MTSSPPTSRISERRPLIFASSRPRPRSASLWSPSGCGNSPPTWTPRPTISREPPARSLKNAGGQEKTVRWKDHDEWMAAKLVGLFGLIVLALVILYLLVTLS